MIPTHVMSFMKKIVTSGDSPPAGSGAGPGGGIASGNQTAGDAPSDGKFSKLRQTLTSGFQQAQETVSKYSASRYQQQQLQQQPDLSHLTVEERSILQKVWSKQQQFDAGNQKAPEAAAVTNQEVLKPPEQQRLQPAIHQWSCKVCVKAISKDEFHRVCAECRLKVCEDCASYSHDEGSEFKCSICRRRKHSHLTLANAIMMLANDESSIPATPTRDHQTPTLELSRLDVVAAAAEALARRHSDAKLQLSATPPNGGGGSLALPSDMSVRRHSDVGPMSNSDTKSSDNKTGGDKSSESSMEDAGLVLTFNSDKGKKTGKKKKKGKVGRQRSADDDETDSIKPPPPHAMQRRASAIALFFPPGTSGIPLNLTITSSAGGATGTTNTNTGTATVAGGRQRYSSDGSEDDPGKSNGLTEPTPSQQMRRKSAQPLRTTGDESETSSRVSHPPKTKDNFRETSNAPRQSSVTDAESIRIVIHDVDSGNSYGTNSDTARRIILRRDLSDKGNRTRGFGMRVIGGKADPDGRLGASVVWIVPGGPADKAGVKPGDKVVEWNGVSLLERSFEEVMQVMDRSGDVAELLVEPCPPLPAGQSGNIPGDSTIHTEDTPRISAELDAAGSGPRRHSGGIDSLAVEPGPDGTQPPPSSPTRRKLPRTPPVSGAQSGASTAGQVSVTQSQMSQQQQQSASQTLAAGRIQLQLWFTDGLEDGGIGMNGGIVEEGDGELVVTVVSADEVKPRDDPTLPEAFVQVVLGGVAGEVPISRRTDVAEPSRRPTWNSSFPFPCQASELLVRRVEVSLWDDSASDEDTHFLGQVTIELRRAYLDNRPLWHRLHMRPRVLLIPLPRPHFVSHELASRLARSSREQQQRSMSDERDDSLDSYYDDDGDGSSIGGASGTSLALLAPPGGMGLDPRRALSQPGSRRSSGGASDNYLLSAQNAWGDRGAVSQPGSRRSSAHSDVLESHLYASRSFPHSLPQSRRGSCVLARQNSGDREEFPPPLSITSIRERRRSAVAIRNDESQLAEFREIAAARRTSLLLQRTDSQERMLHSDFGSGSSSRSGMGGHQRPPSAAAIQVALHRLAAERGSNCAEVDDRLCDRDIRKTLPAIPRHGKY